MKLSLINNIDVKQEIFGCYTDSDTFFPIIGAVLEGKQTGWCLAASEKNPESVLVVHKFGFSQIIYPTLTESIDHSILELLTGHAALPFLPSKFRVYAASDLWNAAIQNRKQLVVEETERIRFYKSPLDAETNECESLSSDNIEEVSKSLNLDLGTRFWDSFRDAAQQSFGVFSKDDDGVSSCACYGSAISDGKAEIDVMTRPDQRNNGLATRVVNCFASRCMKNGIQPVWDCFANNTPSLRTALRCGFKQTFSYRFLTIKPAAS